MTIIFYNSRKPPVRRTLKKIEQFYREHKQGITTIDTIKLLQNPSKPRTLFAGAKPQRAISLGGDGTLLTASRYVLDLGIPLLGINLGGLGFLSAGDESNWQETLAYDLEDKLLQESRFVIEAEVLSCRGKKHFAVINDCVVRTGQSPRMLELEIHVEGGALASRFHGDGLIVATPTGSTAYALSAGGPIVEPRLNVYVLVPLAPHSLTQRPLVLDAQKILTIKLGSYHAETSKALLSIDGQVSVGIESEDIILLRAHKKRLLLRRRQKPDYFQLLREKLNWAS